MPVAKKTVDESTAEDPWGFQTSSEKGDKNVPARDFLTLTLKAGAGFDAPWFVLHTDSVQEAVGTLEDDDFPHLVDLTVARSREFAKAFGGSGGVSRGSAGGSWAKGAGGSSKGFSGDVSECEHGDRVERSGRSAKGPWTGYFCPSRVCDPIFK